MSFEAIPNKVRICNGDGVRLSYLKYHNKPELGIYVFNNVLVRLGWERRNGARIAVAEGTGRDAGLFLLSESLNGISMLQPKNYIILRVPFGSMQNYCLNDSGNYPKTESEYQIWNGSLQIMLPDWMVYIDKKG